MALHPSAEMMVQVLNDSGLTFGPDATPGGIAAPR